MQKFILIISVILLFSFQKISFALSHHTLVPLNHSTLKNLKFTFQPYEAAGTSCDFKFDPSMNDYDIKCNEQQFKVHFFVRGYTHPKQTSLEVLMQCHRISKISTNDKNSNWSTIFWIHSSKETKFESLLVSLGLDNDTASLDARFDLENEVAK